MDFTIECTFIYPSAILPLSLFMFWIFAYNHNITFASNSLTFLANRFYGWSYFHVLYLPYQLAFFMPGSCPLYAKFLKQIRHNLNFLSTLCGRPHCWQRVYSWTLNFLVRPAFIFNDFFAIDDSFLVDCIDFNITIFI